MRLEDLAPIGIAFVVVAITLSIGADVVQDIQTANCANQTAGVGEPGYCGYEIYGNGTDSIGELASWLPTIALVIAAAVVIGIVVTYFAFRR
jgi:hypothetical protein